MILDILGVPCPASTTFLFIWDLAPARPETRGRDFLTGTVLVIHWTEDYFGYGEWASPKHEGPDVLCDAISETILFY